MKLDTTIPQMLIAIPSIMHCILIDDTPLLATDYNIAVSDFFKLNV